jgi:hypothetical protein
MTTLNNTDTDPSAESADTEEVRPAIDGPADPTDRVLDADNESDAVEGARAEGEEPGAEPADGDGGEDESADGELTEEQLSAIDDPTHPHHRRAVLIDELRALERRAVHVRFIGKIHAPSRHDVVYAAGMAALVAFSIVEWPLALAVVGGHALVRQHHSRSLSAIGEVMEDFMH